MYQYELSIIKVYMGNVAHNRKEMINLKFGLLKVVNIDHVKDKKIQYRCICDCGNTAIVSGINLRRGLTKSCGCIRRNKAKEQIKKLRPERTGKAAFNKLLREYKQSAKKRGYEFSLSEVEFKDLIESNCYYCGSKPNKKQNTYYNDEFILYNGIDRVDNTIGYIFSNCITACTMCNQAKHNHTKQEFKDWIKLIYNNIENI